MSGIVKGGSPMSRVRFLFSKRGVSAFVPHVEMPPLLARSARRAGLEILQTEGFSPHPRISLGPALPVGVPAMAEPAEIWVSEWEDSMLEAWRASMPGGFGLLRAKPVEGPALSRLCKAAEYRVYFRGPVPEEKVMAEVLEKAVKEEGILLSFRQEEEHSRIVLAEPDRFGPSLIVKSFGAASLIGGWQDMLIVRTTVGFWEEPVVKPLV
jgi:radical SAM-linked protein